MASMNLYLIGYRGSGKSTVAPLVADQLGWTFRDSDDLVEAESGLTIAEVFSQQGESAFRKLESRVISGLARQSRVVISLGGGAPMFPENRQSIRNSGKTVWLKADAGLLWGRISGDGTSAQRRPDLTDQGGLAEVQSLLTERGPVYNACADYTLAIGSMTPQEIADRIVNWFESVDK
jgi:shikimate kinase